MRKSRLKALLTVAVFLLCTAHHAGAAVLVEYGFGTNSATATYDPTSTIAGVTGSAITAAPSGINGAGSGWGTGTGANTSGISTSTGNPINALFTRGPLEATEADAYNKARYFSLTLDPDNGMSLSSLTFDYFKDSPTSNSAFFLQTDAAGDNFSTTIASGTLPGSSTNGWQPTTVNLSGVASLQNVTQAVTLRIYFYGSSTDTRITRYDNLTVNGDLAVPEPAAGVLALAGLGAVLTGRRGGRP